jgi:TolB-like protein
MSLQFGRCQLDLDLWELRRDGEVVQLEPLTMRVLAKLIERRPAVVGKTELLDSVWGDRFVSESALTTQIKELRRAVGDDGRSQAVVKTVHGQGYRFVADVTEDGPGSVPGAAAAMAEHEHLIERGENPLVAVLPFEPLSAEPSFRHVSDGLTSDVVTALSKHRWLRVVPRSTSSSYGDDPDAVAALVADLGVDYVVEGSVRVGEGRLRVTVNLTDAATHTCLWAERYDRRYHDLFDVLDEIVDLVVATVEPEVGHAERNRVSRRPPADLKAWDLYHLGVAHFFRFTAADNLEAQRLLDEARTIDPGFAEAHAWWAYAVVLGMTYWETEPDDATLDQALGATTTALATDDHNAVFHMLRGRVQLARRDYGAAMVENERAVALNPTMAAAFCGLGDSLCYEGRYDEAIEHFTRSVELGTHDPQRWAFLSYGALALVFAGRYEDAIEWSRRASSIPNCQYWTTAHRVVALAKLGRTEECDRAVAELLEQCPRFTIAFARRRLFYLKRPEQLRLYLDGLEAAGVPAG